MGEWGLAVLCPALRSVSPPAAPNTSLWCFYTTSENQLPPVSWSPGAPLPGHPLPPVRAVLTEAGPAPRDRTLCSPHLPGPALGGLDALLAQCLPSPLISSRTQPGPVRATSQLLTRSLEHLGEPVGMSLQEPWLLAAMLRPVERGHGAWSPQPPATASLHGAAGACPILTSGHPARASFLPLVTLLQAPGPPLTPQAPASPTHVPSRVEISSKSGSSRRGCRAWLTSKT